MAARKGSTSNLLGPEDQRGNTIQSVVQFLSIFKNGLLDLTLCGGQNLYTKSGKKPRPFCIVYQIEREECGVEPRMVEKTDVADSNPVNPTWNKTISIEVPPTTAKFQIHVVSHHRLGRNRLIGVFDLNMAMMNENYIEVEPTIVDLVQDQSAKIKGKLILKWSFTSAFARNNDFRIAFMHYKKIIPILCSPPGFHLAMCLSHALSSEDVVAVALIRIFNSQSQSKEFVLRLLAADIDNNLKTTAAGNTLFRRDSPATRMCSHYFKLIGYKYLHDTLSQKVTALLADTTHYEIDPHRAGSKEDVSKNAERLIVAVAEILQAVFGATDRIPLNMRRVLLLVKGALEQRGRGDLAPVVIVNLFFLRYLCPAIFLPEQCYLVDSDVSPEGRRFLTLMTKIIQTLATGVKQEDSTLEPFMLPLFPMLQPMRAATEKFISELLEPVTAGPADEFHSRLEDDDYAKLLSVVINKTHGKFEKIEKEIATHINNESLSGDAVVKVQEQFTTLKSLLTSGH